MTPPSSAFRIWCFLRCARLLRARLIAGRPMSFIDATNLSPKERHSWIKMAHDFGYEAHAVFFDVPTEVCMERNRKRLRNVPDEVMLRMAQKLRPPKFDEGFAKVIVVRLKSKKGAAPECPRLNCLMLNCPMRRYRKRTVAKSRDELRNKKKARVICPRFFYPYRFGLGACRLRKSCECCLCVSAPAGLRAGRW